MLVYHALTSRLVKLTLGTNLSINDQAFISQLTTIYKMTLKSNLTISDQASIGSITSISGSITILDEYDFSIEELTEAPPPQPPPPPPPPAPEQPTKKRNTLILLLMGIPPLYYIYKYVSEKRKQGASH